ncbi:MAG TPA: hypothetical protein VEQ11_21360 [Chloroflexota bacterium]|nr:hypothetical protein [Chloroflexota bacterium]
MPPLSSRLAASLLSLSLLLLSGGPPAHSSFLVPHSSLASPEPTTLDLLDSSPQPIRDPVALMSRITGVALPRLVVGGPVEPLQVGRLDNFWVLDQTTNTYRQRDGELRLASPNAYWYVEIGQRVSQDELARSAAVFEEQTYPTVHLYFGTEWSPGIDGDPRITIFLTTVPAVTAYFSSWDEYPRAVYPYSNEREMIHLGLGALRPGTASFDGTLAHEFQHMVHWNMNPSEETWVDEGSAELASWLAVSARSIGTGQFERQPDLQLTSWAEPRVLAPHYQAAFLFMQYFASHYGGPDGLRGLLSERGRPPETFNRYLHTAGYGVVFDDIFEDWLVANVVNDPAVDGGRFAHQRSDIRVALLARLRPDDPPMEDDVHQYGADYVELDGDGSDAELVFEGQPTVRLVGADPTSGQKMWWSNRGDGLDASMTRVFDLRGVGSATLRFNLWFETEKDYDLFYVMASGDGGATWRVLRGANASDWNPTGNAVGPGYSGKSGTPGPIWVGEEVDLSPYAGREVLLRFEYVTDQATNFRGVLLDDVAIPEIGYIDDAESETGWAYDGFIRSDNMIPQPWGLRLVQYQRGGGVTIKPLVPDPDRRLVERLPSLGGSVERAILATSGLAPRTLETARYRVVLRRAA